MCQLRTKCGTSSAPRMWTFRVHGSVPIAIGGFQEPGWSHFYKTRSGLFMENKCTTRSRTSSRQSETDAKPNKTKKRKSAPRNLDWGFGVSDWGWDETIGGKCHKKYHLGPSHPPGIQLMITVIVPSPHQTLGGMGPTVGKRPVPEAAEVHTVLCRLPRLPGGGAARVDVSVPGLSLPACIRRGD